MRTLLDNADIIGAAVGIGGLGAIARDIYANGLQGVDGGYLVIVVVCFTMFYIGIKGVMGRLRP